MKNKSILGFFSFFAVLSQCISVNIKQFNSINDFTLNNLRVGHNSHSYVKKPITHKYIKSRKSAKRAENQARNKQH